MNSIATVQILRPSVYLFVCRRSYVSYGLLTADGHPPGSICACDTKKSLRKEHRVCAYDTKKSSYVLAALLRVTGKL